LLFVHGWSSYSTLCALCAVGFNRYCLFSPSV
jgi:hypothetical protein